MGTSKAAGRAVTIPVGLACGALSAAEITLLGAALTANLIGKEMLKWDHIGYAVLLILLLSSWVNASVSIYKIKRRRLLVGITSGLVYFGILLIVTALFFGGQFSGVGETALLILCGSLLGVISGYNYKHRKNRNRINRYNR